MSDQNTPHTDKPKKAPPAFLKNKYVVFGMYALVALLFCGGVYMLYLEYFIGAPKREAPPPAPSPAVSTPTPAATPPPEESGEQPAAPTPTPTPAPRIAPAVIYFPNADLAADVYPVGRNEDNSIQSLDSAFDAGWYELGAAPGEPGNCIINGHNRWKRKGTFSYLKEMEYGEEVIVEREDGSLVYYEVYSIDKFPYDQFPPMILSQELFVFNRLTLITCEGDFDRELDGSYTRAVVTCKEVAVVEAE